MNDIDWSAALRRISPGAPNLGELALDIEAVGSRVTCNPAPTDTDRDWLVLTTNLDELVKQLREQGWEGGDVDETYGEDTEEDARFVSMRMGVENLIITESGEFYTRFMAATAVAKRLNLMRKEDRIALFQAVLYARIWEPGQGNAWAEAA